MTGYWELYPGQRQPLITHGSEPRYRYRATTVREWTLAVVRSLIVTLTVVAW